MDRIDWDTMFMTMAFLACQRSPDEQTKIGAVLTDKHHRVLGMGFNGFPRGAKDHNLPKTRPDKYFYMVHAEDNCISNSNVIPEPEKCTMYITAFPCEVCLKKIIQEGIGKVVYGRVTTALKDLDEEYLGKISLMIDGVPIELVAYSGTGKDISNLLSVTSDYVKSRV